jgi:hypothetical protein
MSQYPWFTEMSKSRWLPALGLPVATVLLLTGVGGLLEALSGTPAPGSAPAVVERSDALASRPAEAQVLAQLGPMKRDALSETPPEPATAGEARTELEAPSPAPFNTALSDADAPPPAPTVASASPPPPPPALSPTAKPLSAEALRAHQVPTARPDDSPAPSSTERPKADQPPSEERGHDDSSTP